MGRVFGFLTTKGPRSQSIEVVAGEPIEVPGIWPGHRYRVRARAVNPEAPNDPSRWWIGDSEPVTAVPGRSIDLGDITIREE